MTDDIHDQRILTLPTFQTCLGKDFLHTPKVLLVLKALKEAGSDHWEGLMWQQHVLFTNQQHLHQNLGCLFKFLQWHLHTRKKLMIQWFWNFMPLIEPIFPCITDRLIEFYNLPAINPISQQEKEKWMNPSPPLPRWCLLRTQIPFGKLAQHHILLPAAPLHQAEWHCQLSWFGLSLWMVTQELQNYWQRDQQDITNQLLRHHHAT